MIFARTWIEMLFTLLGKWCFNFALMLFNVSRVQSFSWITGQFIVANQGKCKIVQCVTGQGQMRQYVSRSAPRSIISSVCNLVQNASQNVSQWNSCIYIYLTIILYLSYFCIDIHVALSFWHTVDSTLNARN